jgi:hypothetical protein
MLGYVKLVGQHAHEATFVLMSLHATAGLP